MRRLSLLALVLVVWGAGGSRPLEAASFVVARDGLDIEVSAIPNPPREWEWVTYTVRLREGGAPLVRAKVWLFGSMPDGMTTRADLRPGGTEGVYSGRLMLTMRGEWAMRLSITHPRGKTEIAFTEQVWAR